MSQILTCGSTGRDYIHDGVEPRWLMAKLPTPDTRYAFPSWGAAGKPVVPRAQWKAVDWGGWLRKVLDQDGKNACTGYSFAGVMGAAFAAAGASGFDFSPTYCYALNNGGSDNGAMCGDLVKSGQGGGCALEEDFPESKLFSRQISAAAKASALRFKLSEVYQVTSFDEYGSALMDGFFVYHGFQVGQRFSPGSDGLLPDFAGSGGGHATFSFGLKDLGSSWTGRLRNSWGQRWGMQGNCFIPESYFWYERTTWRGRMRNLDAWAFKAVLESPADLNTPPDLRPLAQGA